MIYRKALDYLISWKNSGNRKPLVLRGARQVGKSTLVEIFSRHYDTYLKLNLEKPSDSILFDKYKDTVTLLKAIYLHNKKVITKKSTLLFIDEIQHNARAISMLRYFYEEAPHIHPHISWQVSRQQCIGLYADRKRRYLCDGQGLC